MSDYLSVMDPATGHSFRVSHRDIVKDNTQIWDEAGNLRQPNDLGYPPTWEEVYAKFPDIHRDVPSDQRPKGPFTRQSVLEAMDGGLKCPVAFMVFKPIRTREQEILDAMAEEYKEGTKDEMT